MALVVSLVLGLGHAGGVYYAKRHPAATCPFGGKQASWNVGTMPWQARRAVPGHGTVDAPELATLRLAAARLHDLDAWANAHGCAFRGKRRPLECVCPAPSAFGADYRSATTTTAFFQLDKENVMQDFTLLTTYPDAASARAAYAAHQAAWTERFGPISHQSGDPSKTFTAGALLKQTKLEFHRENVMATLCVTNFGSHYDVEQTITTP